MCITLTSHTCIALPTCWGACAVLNCTAKPLQQLCPQQRAWHTMLPPAGPCAMSSSTSLLKAAVADVPVISTLPYYCKRFFAAYRRCSRFH
ncbi:hypothetical protein COO60DRAFT_1495070 [Scenedesmus sp. NREL 46B-D3]|nr:hypothetical protein COO60DRAFT_1495070 [Scenedesmus sp. NREL 46B-D3]